MLTQLPSWYITNVVSMTVNDCEWYIVVTHSRDVYGTHATAQAQK